MSMAALSIGGRRVDFAVDDFMAVVLAGAVGA